MKAAYARAMDALYLLCVAIAGCSLVVMTVIIPWGVYRRYWLNSAAAWPEPASVLLVILFTFIAAAACYRAGVHISVVLFTNALPSALRRAVNMASDLSMALLSLFMVIWGIQLVETTWNQVIAEFPFLSVGITYLPIPVSGALTLLFIVERLWIGPPSRTSFVYREPVDIH
ncbi:MAG TPA: TRAP transporter small permease [Alphaproteobacteria bacterium]|nr:TRAP transporter small permease [Alphaproteobacteria bacterium]